MPRSIVTVVSMPQYGVSGMDEQQGAYSPKRAELVMCMEEGTPHDALCVHLYCPE